MRYRHTDMPSSVNSRRQVIGTFEEIRRAMLANDAAALKNRIGADYSGCGADGMMHDRAAMLDAYGSGGVSLQSFDVSDLEARILGTTALLTGTARIAGSFAGERFEHFARFLDVYELRGSSWFLIASQTTDITGASLGP